MDIAVKWDIILSCSSFFLAALSVIFVVITLRQNSKMIENATRPYICVYGDFINSGSPQFFIVIKNFGSSAATLTRFHIQEDLSDCYGVSPARDYLSEISGGIFAPGQSRICRMDYQKVPDLLHISLEYSSGKKTYSENLAVNIKSGVDMVTTKVATKDKELRTISYTLQEMVQKNL